jgi:hypothetical protein
MISGNSRASCNNMKTQENSFASLKTTKRVEDVAAVSRRWDDRKQTNDGSEFQSPLMLPQFLLQPNFAGIYTAATTAAHGPSV